MSLDGYIRSARQAGCPPDQIHNFVMAGAVLQPKQLSASAIARQVDNDPELEEFGYGGARGGAKSHWLLAQLGLDDCQRRKGLKCLLLRKVGKSGQESFEDLRIKVFPHIAHDYTAHRGILTFQNGSRIHLGHFKDERDVDNYLGLEYDVIGVEEATTLSKSKYDAIGTCCRTSRPDWKPRIYSTTNPGGVGHAWYKKLFIDPYRRKDETFTRFLPATVDDNKFANPSYKARLERLTGWKKRAWRYGDWDIAAGQFFSTFRHDIHVIRPFRVPTDWRFWGSLDYGYQHYTVFHLFAESGDGELFTLGEYAARRAQVADNATGIKALCNRWSVSAEALDIVAGTDVFAKREGPTVAARYEDAGITLLSANMDRVNGWSEMLNLLGDPDKGTEPRWKIFDTCPMLVEQLPMLEHNPRRPEDVLKINADEDGNGGDDAADCARYGIMSRQQANNFVLRYAA